MKGAVITTDETVETRVVVLDLVHLGSVVIEKTDETAVDLVETGQEDLLEDLEGSFEDVMLNGKQMNALLICVLAESAIGNT